MNGEEVMAVSVVGSGWMALESQNRKVETGDRDGYWNLLSELQRENIARIWNYFRPCDAN